MAEVLPDLHPNYHGIVETMVCSMAARCARGVMSSPPQRITPVLSELPYREVPCRHTLYGGKCGRWRW